MSASKPSCHDRGLGLSISTFETCCCDGESHLDSPTQAVSLVRGAASLIAVHHPLRPPSALVVPFRPHAPVAMSIRGAAFLRPPLRV